jgi:hypothetical protein
LGLTPALTGEPLAASPVECVVRRRFARHFADGVYPPLHSTPFAAKKAFAAGLAKKAMNALAVWGDAAPLMGAAA